MPFRSERAQWEGIGISGGGSQTAPTISPHDPNFIILYCNMTCAFRSTDGGETWSRIARKSFDHFSATVHPTRAGWVYMTCFHGEEGGLWLSKDGGDTWQPMSDLPFRNPHRVHFDPDDESIIYVTTFGGSVWRGPVAG